MRLDEPQRFLIQRWAEGLVVFDRLLGDTHAMGEPTASLFEAWLSAPADKLETLACRVPAPEEALQAAIGELRILFPQR